MIDIHHDGRRVVLTENALISVRGFFNIKATTVEYKDIVLVEVFDHVTGRMLGYGDIKVTIGGAGGKQITFEKIPHYMKIKNIIERTKLSQERGMRRKYRR